MRTLWLTAALLACAAPASERAVAGGAQAREAPGGSPPLPAWAPRMPAREAEDRAEIAALLAALERADQGGDVHAVADLLDFPLLTVSDDRRGEAVSTTWTRERWVKAMAPISGPLPGVAVEHRPSIFVVSDAIAVVYDEQTVTRRGRSLPGRLALVLVRTPAGWRVTAMLEGGWGEMMRRLDRDAAEAAGER